MGNSQPPWRCRNGLTPHFPERVPSNCEARGVDDETVDRHSVNPSLKAGWCPTSLVETGCADPIMAWLQQQPTRERPDTLRKLSIVRRSKSTCNDGADHTFRRSASCSISLSSDSRPRSASACCTRPRAASIVASRSAAGRHISSSS